MMFEKLILKTKKKWVNQGSPLTAVLMVSSHKKAVS